MENPRHLWSKLFSLNPYFLRKIINDYGPCSLKQICQIFCVAESNNIALGGKVSPSEGEKKTASWKVIDGFSTALPSWGGCVTSNTQNNPWFAVELKEFYDVQSITLYSSRECCGKFKVATVT